MSENSGGGSTKEHVAPPFWSRDIVFHINNNYPGIGAGFGVLLIANSHCHVWSDRSSMCAIQRNKSQVRKLETYSVTSQPWLVYRLENKI